MRLRGGCGRGASRLGWATGHLAREELQTDEQPDPLFTGKMQVVPVHVSGPPGGVRGAGLLRAQGGVRGGAQKVPNLPERCRKVAKPKVP
eukprot:7532838-Alexandrium_andersonii.AAC.1